MKGAKRQNKGHGSVRIIAGKWRGRLLPVADVPGLRPSGDRGRETLFNWLQPQLRGAACVDLFAGTGVLGLEAVSRGAATAVLVEKSRPAAAALRASVTLLGAAAVSVVEADALQWLQQQAARSVDVVFVDPPFDLALQQAVIDCLTARDTLRPGGVVYLESARTAPTVVLAPGWQILKDQVLGEVQMQLLRRS
jgi:16S rRNA (guanine966-N2)-methyltransferase